MRRYPPIDKCPKWRLVECANTLNDSSVCRDQFTTTDFDKITFPKKIDWNLLWFNFIIDRLE